MASAGAGPRLPGVAALFQQPEKSKSSVPAPKIRGLMLDAGRVPESMDYYKRVVDFCAEWGLNTIQFRIADDQGSALRFASITGIVTHRNAFTPDQLNRFAEYGRDRGVDILPELESFGHTGFITRSPAYSHLLDGATEGPSEFNGVIPVNPETLELFGKLYREVAAIFPSVYLHGGCDEVNWGGSALSRKALESKTRIQVWAEYLNSLHGIAESLGRQFIVWGDVVLHKQPEILALLNKNIVVMDWNYYDNNAARIRETLLAMQANGTRAIGAPALSCWRWGARVGVEQLRNIDAFADAYLASDDPGALGVIVTNWIPSRYIQNSIWDGFAYAAIAFNQGTATAQTSGFRRFVEKHYGAVWNQDWAEAFDIIYAAAPAMKDRATSPWMGLALHVPWSSEEQLTSLLRSAAPLPNPFTRLRGLLVSLEPLVRRSLGDFQAFALCAQALERWLWRENTVLEQAAAPSTDQQSAALLIQAIAERDRALVEALSKDWDRGRPADSEARDAPLYGFPSKDQLVFQWKQAADYSASLAAHPDRFHRLIQPAKSGE